MRTGISKSTLDRAVQIESVLRHSSSIKPLFTDNNKFDRITFAMDHVHYNSRKDANKFKNMYNYVHVDETCFRIMNYHQPFYVATDELKPHRAAKNKNFFEKIIF